MKRYQQPFLHNFIFAFSDEQRKLFHAKRKGRGRDADKLKCAKNLRITLVKICQTASVCSCSSAHMALSMMDSMGSQGGPMCERDTSPYRNQGMGVGS